jgi:mono/diheme cytochrome c family protein
MRTLARVIGSIRPAKWLGLCAILLVGSLLTIGCQADVGESGGLDPTLEAQRQYGSMVFKQQCASCHSTLPDVTVVGPSLAGVWQRAGDRIPGMPARDYLEGSIQSPGSYVVEGFSDLMPATLGQSLTEEEVDAILVYLTTLDP